MFQLPYGDVSAARAAPPARVAAAEAARNSRRVGRGYVYMVNLGCGVGVRVNVRPEYDAAPAPVNDRIVPMSVSLSVRGACPHDCPDTCAVVTEVRDGRAVSFRGDPENPVTRGWLCAQV